MSHLTYSNFHKMTSVGDYEDLGLVRTLDLDDTFLSSMVLVMQWLGVVLNLGFLMGLSFLDLDFDQFCWAYTLY